MFEHKSQNILPAHRFLIRLLRMVALTTVALLIILGGGALVFAELGDTNRIEGFHHAVWVMMGHQNELHDHEVEPSHRYLLFETLYVLVSRLVLFTSAAFVVTPIFHRIMHKLHLDDVK